MGLDPAVILAQTGSRFHLGDSWGVTGSGVGRQKIGEPPGHVVNNHTHH